MRLIRLEIEAVRNLSSVAIDCARGLNLFVGPNGAGKTAILEAVHLLARGRSFRSSLVEPIIQRDAEALLVRAQFDDEHRGRLSAGVVRQRGNRIDLRLNEAPERRTSEVARLMPIQMALPDAASLVFGGPRERRRFVDWGTFHVKPSYLDELRDFQRTMQQRNSLLRRLKDRETFAEGELVVWTKRLVVQGERVDATRQQYLERLLPLVRARLHSLDQSIRVEISYKRGWRENSTLEDSLREAQLRDVKFGLTHCGPHRGDLHLDIGGHPAAATLSRGQAKVVASALVLAQAEATTQIAGRRSLFLIDDVGAELDAAHNERFFRALEEAGCQVLATATSVPPLGSAFAGSRQVFHVEQGSCHPIDT